MTISILNLPVEIRRKIFENLKEQGGITHMESVATTCKQFLKDIQTMSLQLAEIRILYDRLASVPLSPDKVRMNGLLGHGDFHMGTPIAHVAKILGGNQSSAQVSDDCVQRGSHVLPVYEWAPLNSSARVSDDYAPLGTYTLPVNEWDQLHFTALENRGDILDRTGQFKKVEIKGELCKMVHFNGDPDRRTLRELGLRPGYAYQYVYRLNG